MSEGSTGVAVLGGGVIGFTTGIVLARRGLRVSLYAESVGAGTASSAACAMWLPFLMGGSNADGPETEELNESRRWAEVSWNHFQKLTGPDRGVLRTRWLELFVERPETPYYADVVDSFEEGEFEGGYGSHAYSWRFNTFVIEMPKYYPWLVEEFERLGGTVHTRRVDAFSDLSEAVVFNCTGLGSRALCEDSALKPIKGQLLLHSPLELSFALGAAEFCVIPRSDGLVIGSLFLEDDESMMADQSASDALWEQALELERTPLAERMALTGKLTKAAIQDVVVGIRPYRKLGVRLEREEVLDKVVYHDYGHGGSGVTFSWGCATSSAEEFEWQLESQLRSIGDTRPAAVCDLSLEVGHVEVDELSPGELSRVDAAIKSSMAAARSLISELVSSGRSYSISVLIDDKRFEGSARSDLVAALRPRLDGLGVDYLCLESNLDSAARELLPRLVGRAREGVSSRLTMPNGRLSCPQDILVWYALRLGIVEGAVAQIRPVSTGARRQPRPFAANHLVSILSSSFEKAELEAETMIRECFGPEVAAACGRMYV